MRLLKSAADNQINIRPKIGYKKATWIQISLKKKTINGGNRVSLWLPPPPQQLDEFAFQQSWLRPAAEAVAVAAAGETNLSASVPAGGI